MSEYAVIKFKTRTVATLALAVKRSNHLSRSHPLRLDLTRTLNKLLLLSGELKSSESFEGAVVFRIRKFLGLPDPDPLVSGTDSDQDTSNIKLTQQEKNLDFYCFVTSL